MAKTGGKKPVTVKVGDTEHVLQVPCHHCRGGEFLAYSPHGGRTHVGQCLECKDGLVDTPLFAAIKRQMGIYDELPGSWRAQPVHDFAAMFAGKLALALGIEGTEHFYPDSWMPRKQYDRALCGQGDSRDRVLSGKQLDPKSDHCKNCERIKAARERAIPSIYEQKEV